MTSTQDVLEHRDAMLDVFTEITQDCLLLGLTPCNVSVSKHRALLSAAVHFADQDTAAVDRLADSYVLPGPMEDHPNYTRRGRFDLDGRRVDVEVFSGRPKAAEPDAEPGHPFAAVFDGTVDMRRPVGDGDLDGYLREKGERS